MFRINFSSRHRLPWVLGIVVAACFLLPGAATAAVTGMQNDAKQRLLARSVRYLCQIEHQGSYELTARVRVVSGLLEAGFSPHDSFLQKQLAILERLQPRNDEESRQLRDLGRTLRIALGRECLSLPPISASELSLTIVTELRNYQEHYRRFGTLMPGCDNHFPDGVPIEARQLLSGWTVTVSPTRKERSGDCLPLFTQHSLPSRVEQTEKAAFLKGRLSCDYTGIVLADRRRE